MPWLPVSSILVLHLSCPTSTLILYTYFLFFRLFLFPNQLSSTCSLLNVFVSWLGIIGALIQLIWMVEKKGFSIHFSVDSKFWIFENSFSSLHWIITLSVLDLTRQFYLSLNAIASITFSAHFWLKAENIYITLYKSPKANCINSASRMLVSPTIILTAYTSYLDAIQVWQETQNFPVKVGESSSFYLTMEELTVYQSWPLPKALKNRSFPNKCWRKQRDWHFRNFRNKIFMENNNCYAKNSGWKSSIW